MTHHPPDTVARRVRAEFWPCAISAVLLSYFGFAVFEFQPVTDLFRIGDAIFNYALRIGGVGMALAAAAALTGFSLALLFNAVLSVAIGAALTVGGGFMIAGGGMALNQILYLIFGAMFVSGGLRNGRDYFLLAAVSFDEPSTATNSLQEVEFRRRDGEIIDSRIKNDDIIGRNEIPVGGFLAKFAEKRGENDAKNGVSEG